jgi:hypothetical protein
MVPNISQECPYVMKQLVSNGKRVVMEDEKGLRINPLKIVG